MDSSSFLADIPRETAYRAHTGTSFVPERRAAQEQADYAATLAADWETLSTHANTPEKQAILAEEFARYREGYRRRKLASLHSRSRLVSWMIAGPSNFPAKRMEKRGDIAHKRLTELLDFRSRAMAAIIRKLHPERRPIMAGDADATERLAKKIEQAERLQEAMKRANEIVRRKPKNEPTPEKLADLLILGFSAAKAAELFKPDFCGRLGFPSYELTNNNANIRRMRERLEQISRVQSELETETEGEHARIEDCPSSNRVRLFFPGKPDEVTRSTLKKAGFRWTPSLGCWQAYRNYNSQSVARSVAGVTQ